MNIKTTLLGPSIIGVLALLTGCASSNEQPVPSYQTPSAYAQPYRYPPQQQTSQAPAAPPPQTYSQSSPATADNTGTAAQAAAQHPETIPASPGPDYVWMPSYWTIGVSGGWVWVGGHYVLRGGAAEEQLRAARGMLEQARMELGGSRAKSINRALEEINEALQPR